MATASGARPGTSRCAAPEPQAPQVFASAERARRPRKMARALQVLAIAFAVSIAAGSGSSAWAQAVSNVPRAGSSIGNQASATYTDGSGATRTATSNTVQTVVTQIPGVSLTQDQDVRGATGQPVYFPHVVSNTGNGPSSFNLSATESSPNLTGPNGTPTLQIFPDRNRDGRPDPGEPAITVTPTLQPGEDFSFVVAGEVPGGVTSGTAAVTVTATSVATPATPATVTATNNDTLTVTGNAVINIVKSVSSAGGAPSSSGYNYTLTYTNNGNTTSGPIVITDDLPEGLAYRPNSGLWSVGGLALSDPADGAQGAAPDTIDYSATPSPLGAGRTRITATISRAQPGTNFFVRFGFDVAPNATPGPHNNTATFNYIDTPGGTTTIPSTTNTVPFNVTPTGGVTGTGDNFGPVPQGSLFDFVNTFTNSGTGPDTFDIALTAPGSFPAGTSFLLLRAPNPPLPARGANNLVANAAPLVDSNGNGIPDTGQLAVGGSVAVIVRVQLPPGTSGNNNGPGFSVSKTATSPSTGSSVIDTDVLTSITPATLDLRNSDPNSTTPPGADNGGAGAGTNNIINTYAANAGGTTRILLSVTNTSTQPDNYNLAFSGSTLANAAAPTALPPGYTVRFVDANGAVITNTGNVLPGQTITFFAEVVPPPTATPATLDLFFRATSASGGSASDFLRDQIVVGTRRAIQIEPNNTGQTFQGSSITYGHTITNSGNVDETVVLTSVNSGANFTNVNYVDVNNNGVIDTGDTLVPPAGILVPAGQTVSILTRVFAPSDASPGAANTTTLTATATGAIPNTTAPSDTATDTTTVVAGQLRLVKEQALDANNDGVEDGAFSTANINAAPGQGIRYRITVTNIGTQPVSSIVITDATPGFTTYFAPTAASAATLTDPAGAASPAAAAPNSGGTGALRFEYALTAGQQLLSGQSVVASFGVRVNG